MGKILDNNDIMYCAHSEMNENLIAIAIPIHMGDGYTIEVKDTLNIKTGWHINNIVVY